MKNVFQASDPGLEKLTFQEYILLENITSTYHYPCVLGKDFPNFSLLLLLYTVPASFYQDLKPYVIVVRLLNIDAVTVPVFC
jgi:hypothetical protein